jgi:hypothetical protein
MELTFTVPKRIVAPLLVLHNFIQEQPIALHWFELTPKLTNFVPLCCDGSRDLDQAGGKA